MTSKPKRKGINIMAMINNAIPLADDQQRDLGIAYHVSLQALLRGGGTEQAWSTLACTLNIAMLLCEQGFSPAALPTIKLAQDALLRARARANRTGKGRSMATASASSSPQSISTTSRSAGPANGKYRLRCGS